MAVNPRVIDISSYQNVQNWDLVKSQGYVGVINKVTEGHTIKDWTFAVRYKPVTDRGMLFGAYHFLRPGDIPGQVDWFLSNISVVVDPSKILLVLDHEDSRNSLADVKLFLRLVKEKTGQYPLLYSGGLVKDQLDAVGGYDAELAQYRLWLAQYNSTCTWPKTWQKYFLWQFTGDGVGPAPHLVQGIIGADGGSSAIDISSFAGADSELGAQWIDYVSKPTVVTPAPKPVEPPVVVVAPAPVPVPVIVPVQTVKPVNPIADFLSRFKFW